MQKQLRFEEERETKGTIRFTEVVGDLDEPAAGDLVRAQGRPRRAGLGTRAGADGDARGVDVSEQAEPTKNTEERR